MILQTWRILAVLTMLMLEACGGERRPMSTDPVANARPGDESAILAMPSHARADVDRWYNRLWASELKARWAYDWCSRLKHTRELRGWTGRISEVGPDRIDIDLDDAMMVSAKIDPAVAKSLASLDSGQAVRFSGALEPRDLDRACGGWDEIGAGSSPLTVRLTHATPL